MTHPQSCAGLKLRTDVFRRHCAQIGALTLSEKSVVLGVDSGTISRVERGTSPSAKFIASTLAAFPNTTFEVFFELVQHEVAA